MQKNYFQLDKVHSVTLKYEQETHKWFNEVPAKPKTFLGIRYGMTKAISAGWSDYEDGRYPRPSSYFNDYVWYRVDEINKKIYSTAHVDIRFNYKEGIGCNFESNEEAQKYVDDLINTSDKQFHVIVNK